MDNLIPSFYQCIEIDCLKCLSCNWHVSGRLEPIARVHWIIEYTIFIFSMDGNKCMFSLLVFFKKYVGANGLSCQLSKKVYWSVFDWWSNMRFWIWHEFNSITSDQCIWNGNDAKCLIHHNTSYQNVRNGKWWRNTSFYSKFNNRVYLK